VPARREAFGDLEEFVLRRVIDQPRQEIEADGPDSTVVQVLELRIVDLGIDDRYAAGTTVRCPPS